MAEPVTYAANLCGQVADLNRKYGVGRVRAGASPVPVGSDHVVAALDEFMECVRYLNTRRSETTLALTSEGAVQDAVFLMLRPWIRDLIPENPTDRVASRYTIKDFVSLESRCIIEVKYVRDREHGRSISREMHDDIETYRHDARCDSLVFFVFDPDVHIPDRSALKRQIETDRTYAGRSLYCRLVLKP